MLRMLKLVVTLTVIVPATLARAEPESVSPAGSFRSGEVLVGLRDSLAHDELRDLADDLGMKLRWFHQDLGVAKLELSGSSIAPALERAKADHRVAFAEPNYVATASLTPNDARFPSQWGPQAISSMQAWDITPGTFSDQGSASTGVKVAVIDTGVYPGHEELNDGRMLVSDGAHCVNDSSACASDQAWDDNGHGTHVAGIVAAATNNSAGIAGVAFNSRIIPVKVLDSLGNGDYLAVASGITWAAKRGAKVINLSLGGSSYSTALCSAVASAVNTYKAVVVAAAGNDYSGPVSYPAACPGALAITALGDTNALASYSNHGEESFIAAPGSNIVSAVPNYCCIEHYDPYAYKSLSGTSMAAPHVAGVAALLASKDPTLSVLSIKTILAKTAQKAGSDPYGPDPGSLGCGCTWNQRYGYGRVDASRALQALASPGFELSTQTSRVVVGTSDSVQVAVLISRSGNLSDAIDLSTEGAPPGISTAFSPDPVPGSSSTLTISSSGTALGSYLLRINGTTGQITRTAELTVEVAPPDFTLDVTPGSITTRREESSRFTIRIQRLAAFAGTVNLTVSGLPSNSSASFSPASVSGTESVMTFTSAADTPSGSHSLVISGASGSLVRSATVVVTLSGRIAYKGYVGGIGDAADLSCSNLFAGGACFPVYASESGVSLKIVDFSGSLVAARWTARSAGGSVLSTGSFCDRADIPLPLGARRLEVAVLNSGAVMGCGTTGASYGFVESTFTP